MANGLDEINDKVIEERDVGVIGKTLPAKCGKGTKFFFNIGIWFCLVIPGIFVLVKKAKWRSYFSQLEQKLQATSSTIDNLMENRVNILKNAAKLLDKAIDLDKDTFTKIAAYRSGAASTQEGANERNVAAQTMDNVAAKINLAFENYPNLEAHKELADVMQQNNYLQREITAAREQYNDVVFKWNKEIFEWPLRLLVADELGLTTRIPFATSKEIKDASRGTFF